MIPAEDDTTATADTSVTVTALPAFSDNYLWLIAKGTRAAVVDPGDAAVVSAALEARGLTLTTILITHHHPDHIGGLAALKAATGAKVYGPRAEQATIAGLDVLLDDGDRVALADFGLEFDVLAVPGHTLGHIAYFSDRDRSDHGGAGPGTARPPWLFCGDTLFAAGCGRLFEGTPAQMHDSLMRLAALPPETVAYCAHEYTLANLDFARAVEPESQAIGDEITRVQALRARSMPSVPTRLDRERRLNPFLRCDDPVIIAAAAAHAGQTPADAPETFAILRRWKDGHRSTLR